MQMFWKAHAESLKFEGIITSIKAQIPTGEAADENVKRAALAVYNVEEAVRTMYTFLRTCMLDVGHGFAFMQAIRYLRTTSTGGMALQSHSSTSTAQDSGVPSGHSVGLEYSSSAAVEAECQGSAIGGQMSVSSWQTVAGVIGGNGKKP